MPYAVQLITLPSNWPPRIHNIYKGDVTTDDVVSCFHETIELLNKQTSKVDIVGIFEVDASLFNARGILFQKKLIDQVTLHPNLDQIILVDLNNVMTGDFLKRTLQAALSRPDLKVSILGSLAELEEFLSKKYADYTPPPAQASA